ncbi:BPSL0067 family protein [Acidocella facilis]|uniref:BPSL0067 family protein n=1 Tax=Acidocella facilis TaxID=525 RepID=UPI0009DF3DE7|nr:BPSL0067 family protein [Acidocella facilis]
MPYIAQNPNAFLGQSVGDGQCVALVEKAANTPHDKAWSRGILVKGAIVAPGTIIATFDAKGRYGNHTDGTSHAAIYLGQNADGIQVIDQWVDVHNGKRRPHVAQPRTIRWKQFEGKNAKPVNIGDDYYVVQ